MNNLMVFENKPVEVFEWNGKALFNPYHVGKCLELGDSAVRMAMSKMNSKQAIKLTNSNVKDIDFRKLHNTGENFLTESGVYKLIFKSHKEEAEKFQDWVTDEVLPSIRKTGDYNSSKNYTSEILSIIKDLPNDEYKNMATVELLKLIPTNNEPKFVPKIKTELNFKNLLDEFMKQEDVFIKRHPQGIAVDKDKLYTFFSEYGIPKNRVLKHLDDEELIFHYKYSRAVQLRLNGTDSPIRVVIIKDKEEI